MIRGFENKGKRIEIFTAVAGLFFSAMVLFLFARDIFPEKKEVYDIVILGDSIIAKEREFTTISSVISDRTGLRVFSGAFGGTCACSRWKERRYALHEDSVNLVGITDAIINDDFGVQLADTPNNQYKMGYFREVLEEMERIDWKKVSFLLIEHGINDYAGERIPDNMEDPFDTTTYGGALRYAVTKLRSFNPEMKIILVSPNRCIIGNGRPVSEQDFGNGTLPVFLDVQLGIAEEYGLDYIDIYNEAGFTDDNIRSLTEDGLHLNEAGRERYGDYIGKRMKEIRGKG